ncbi:MAG: HEAT repeat domain-containing protein [Myxococcota bacterium]
MPTVFGQSAWRGVHGACARRLCRWPSYGLVALLLTGACAGPRGAVRQALYARDYVRALAAYDELAEIEGHDDVVLGDVARLYLTGEVRADEARSRAAVLQLRMLGRPGQAALRRAVEEEFPGIGRALALKALVDLGDESYVDALRAYVEASEPALRALGLSALSSNDRALARFVEDDAPEVRRAAALRYGDGRDEDALPRLLALARDDPSSRVREGATRVLGSFGEDVSAALVLRLSDPDAGVRLAAARSLLRADPAAARRLLPSWLSSPPTRSSIEVARVGILRSQPRAPRREADFGTRELVAQAPFLDAPQRDEAREHLFRALEGSDEARRMQAAIALVSLRSFERERIVRMVAVEEHDAVRFQLARALEDTFADQAHEVMRAFLDGPATMVRLQAAATLSEEDEERALVVLEETLAGDGPSVFRQVAARALGRRGHRYAELRRYLDDRDPLVRIQAAGALASASSFPRL